MEGFKYVDIFATKGLEYLVVLGFLLTLVIFWQFLNRSRIARAAAEFPERIKTVLVDWFYLAEDFWYHQGHSWVKPENRETVRVGIDDFAQKLLGQPANIQLPKVGSRIRQGEPGWKMQIDGKMIDMLSPVNGQVVAVNQKVINNPSLINDDPYQKGWLMKIKPSRLSADRKNLLFGSLAKAWIEDHVNTLSAAISNDYGIVLQDGGLPVSGFARELSPEHWEKFARKMLLTEETE